MNLEYGWTLDKNTASVFRVARCATRKTDTAINRIKTSETHKLRIENTSGRKRNKNRWGLQTVVTTRNIYGDEQNKNHWDLQTVAVSWKTDAICS